MQLSRGGLFLLGDESIVYDSTHRAAVLHRDEKLQL